MDTSGTIEYKSHPDWRTLVVLFNTKVILIEGHQWYYLIQKSSWLMDTSGTGYYKSHPDWWTLVVLFNTKVILIERH